MRLCRIIAYLLLRRDRDVAETFFESAEEWLDKSRRAVVVDHSMLARSILPEIGAMKAGSNSALDPRDLLVPYPPSL